MDLVNTAKRCLLGVVFILLASQTAVAAWEWNSAGDDQGKVWMSAFAEENGFYISLYCASGEDPNAFSLNFIADDFPNLKSVDDNEIQLIFSFEGQGMEGAAQGWADVWYFAPDKAWTGTLFFEEGMLELFGGASTMRVLTTDSKEVAQFSLAGSRKVEHAVRGICHEGRLPKS